MTLRLDEDAQAFFETLRRRHFPPERNHIPAHVTLFHTLPDSADLVQTLERMAARTEPFRVSVTGLRSLGRGVAYTLDAPELLALHAALSAAFADHLTAQDRQRYMPHVVVQNKVTPEKARTLLAELQRAFVPFEARARGLELWEYLGGPWRHAASFDFAVGSHV